MRTEIARGVRLILEGIGDFASLSKNPDDLSELIRRRLGLYFVPEFESAPGRTRFTILLPVGETPPR